MLKQSRRLLRIFTKERQPTDVSQEQKDHTPLPPYKSNSSTISTSPLTSIQSPDPSPRLLPRSPRLPRSPFSPVAAAAVRQYSSVDIVDDDDSDDGHDVHDDEGGGGGGGGVTTIDFQAMRRGSMNPLNSA